MQLTTDRLLIRSIAPSDRAEYATMVADPEVMKYLGGKPVDAAAAAEYIADCMERDRRSGVSRFTVMHKKDNTFLGICGFKALTSDYGNQVAPGVPWVDFGWRYVRSAWRQGFGFEAASALYGFGKKHLGLENIEARAHRENIGSLRIIEKLGFVWLNDYDSSAGVFRRYREPV